MTNSAQVQLQPDATIVGFGWKRLALMSAVVGVVAMGVVAALLGDKEAAAVAVGFGLASLLLWLHRPRLGGLVLFFVSGATLFFMLTAAVSNVIEGSSTSSVLLPGGLAAVGLVAVISGTLTALGRLGNEGPGPWVVTALGVTVFMAFGLAGLLVTEQANPTDDGLRIVSEDVLFDVTSLTAPAGTVSVSMTNRDLFWHTFTIDELGVDLRVPVGAEITTTFEAEQGVYVFYCAIPGHAQAGMTGTLQVG